MESEIALNEASYGPASRSSASAALLARYSWLRERTDSLTAGLHAEDMNVQSMPDASPLKWHLAHTSWFFEEFLLKRFWPGYKVFNPEYGYLFNSYYEAIGDRHPRPERGLLTRPAITEVMFYRRFVDMHMQRLLATVLTREQSTLVELGIAHEEQHQELMLMDVLHLFSRSPLKPAYQSAWPAPMPLGKASFARINGGLVSIGASGTGFSFDHELPRHKVWLEPYDIADRLVTNGEWLAFMADAGYRRPDLWLSDGWAQVSQQGWDAPLYWERVGETAWVQMSLRGIEEIDPAAPVTHLSFYEADAYARWAGDRLPSEAEWETARLRGLLRQAEDVAWQWTRSAFSPYPGFLAAQGAVGEYNGKFMVNQMVLRGGSVMTPEGHSRPSYRNFFHPGQRWMMAGVRLARDPRSQRLADVEDKVFQVVETDGGQRSDFLRDVLVGLTKDNKALPPKYFYDDTGSRIFEEICQLEEYYPTRTETALLANIGREIAEDLPAGTVLVEFGSGASDKTRLILDASENISGYVPIDISADALDRAGESLRQAYPSLEIAPLHEDFTRAIRLPAQFAGAYRLGFFPGSTIGNFTRAEAIEFFRSARELPGSGARMIVGADLVKDIGTMVSAYDDRDGVTARFNKNLLTRINRELGANFDIAKFEHLAVWNDEEHRMEMHLVSKIDQVVEVADRRISFAPGERLHTENSHKFTLAAMTRLANAGGWDIGRTWYSASPEFGIFELRT